MTGKITPQLCLYSDTKFIEVPPPPSWSSFCPTFVTHLDELFAADIQPKAEPTSICIDSTDD